VVFSFPCFQSECGNVLADGVVVEQICTTNIALALLVRPTCSFVVFVIRSPTLNLIAEAFGVGVWIGHGFLIINKVRCPD
jgi:hypothetical protein